MALVLLPVLALAYGALPRTETFHILDADFADREYLPKLEYTLAHTAEDVLYEVTRTQLSLFAHRIGTGNRTVLAYRRWTPGSIFAMDDEGYEKLTITVPPVLAGSKTMHRAGMDAQIILSKGGSAWPHAGCTWQMSSGSVQVDATSSRYRVHVHGRMTSSASDRWNNCQPEKELDMQFSTHALSLADLSPWLGQAGNHPYAESYR